LKNNLIQKYSLVGSVGVGSMVFLSAYTSMNYGAGYSDYTIFILIASFILLLLETRSGVEQLSFGEAFKHTFLLGIIMMIPATFVFYFVIKYYNRYILEMFQTGALDVIKYLGAPKDMMELQTQKIKSNGPLLFTITFLVEFVMKTLFWSFIISTFLKKEKIEHHDEQY
jgi:hypothetical protein